MTSPSPLERLAGPGNVLAKEAADAKEFDALVRSGLARLKDAEKKENSLESRFDLAYGAAHALCLAALRHHGFRPSKRYIVFQVLPDTLGLGPEVWRVLSKCHDMRNRTEYEPRGRTAAADPREIQLTSLDEASATSAKLNLLGSETAPFLLAAVHLRG
jgi:hypothetical protein